jgi:hypothetical protein
VTTALTLTIINSPLARRQVRPSEAGDELEPPPLHDAAPMLDTVHKALTLGIE